MTSMPARAVISMGFCKVTVSPWAARVTAPASQRWVAFPLLPEPASRTASPLARTVTAWDSESVAHWAQVRNVILRLGPVGFRTTSWSCHSVHMPTRNVVRTVDGAVAASTVGCGMGLTLMRARQVVTSRLDAILEMLYLFEFLRSCWLLRANLCSWRTCSG